jgi:hypothetical protein
MTNNLIQPIVIFSVISEFPESGNLRLVGQSFSLQHQHPVLADKLSINAEGR